MGEIINKEFEKFQDELKIRDKKIKYITKFELSDFDEIMNELKKKEIIL